MSRQPINYQSRDASQPLRVPRGLIVGLCLNITLSSALTAWAWLATSYFQRLEGGNVIDGLPNTAHYQFWGLHLQEAVLTVSTVAIALGTVVALLWRREYWWALPVLPVAFVTWFCWNFCFFLVQESAYP